MKKLVIHQLGQTVVRGLAPQLLDLLLLFQQLIDEITGYMIQFGPCMVDNLKVVEGSGSLSQDQFFDIPS